jgi:hypothetical protein
MEDFQNQPVSSQSNSNQPLQQKPKKHIPTWLGLVIIILAGILLFGGAFAYQFLVNKNQPETVVSQLPETAGWQTYTDTDYGFEIKYPKGWTVSKPVIYVNITNENNKENVPFMQIVRETEMDGLSMEEAANKFLHNTNSSIEKVNTNNGIGRQISFSGICSNGIPCSYKSTVLCNDGKIYSIYYTEDRMVEPGTGPMHASKVAVDMKDWKYYDTFKKILSTLKFNEGSGIPPDWKTYESKDYNFKLNYPKDILFEPEKGNLAPILSSFSQTNLEESNAFDLNVYVSGIKISPFTDAANLVENNSKYYSKFSGPKIANIGGHPVYTVFFSGLSGIEHLYFFPKTLIKFSYSSPSSEKKFSDLEKQMLYEQLKFNCY